MEKTVWRNKKSKELYIVIYNNAVDATNKREGNRIVVYKPVIGDNIICIRDYDEFIEKFE